MRFPLRVLVGVWLGVILAGCGSPDAGGSAGAPLNLSRAKAAVRGYHDDGRYERALTEAARPAAAWLEERAATRRPGERLAVVFDVDETVLSNYPNMVSEDFGYNAADWTAWVARAEAPALGPVREVYALARRLGVAVIFLTGREDPHEREGTARNLAAQGMGDYERLILRSVEDTGATAAERKANRRAQLTAEGWTIIASIGDQESDLAGGYAERVFQLPNPFYEIP